jgi:hypothetical protein
VRQRQLRASRAVPCPACSREWLAQGGKEEIFRRFVEGYSIFRRRLVPDEAAPMRALELGLVSALAPSA